MAAESVAFAGLSLTNPLHHVWTRVTLHSRTLSPILELESAVGYYAHIGSAYLVVALALGTRLAGVVRRKAEDLVTLSEKAHRMVEIRNGNQADSELVDVVSALDPLIAEVREEYPTVAVTVDNPDESNAAIVSQRALTVALRNLLKNAAEHNDAADLAVEIEVITEDGVTRVRVNDDGSGLPEMKQAVLQKHTEAPLEHSNGLGLWLIYRAVSTTGGEISVEASERFGTSITLAFPDRRSSSTEASNGATQPSRSDNTAPIEP